MNIDQTLRAVANFVKDLPSIELDAVAQKVFNSPTDPRCLNFKQSVQYYVNGTKDGFLHYKPIKPTKGKYLFLNFFPYILLIINPIRTIIIKLSLLLYQIQFKKIKVSPLHRIYLQPLKMNLIWRRYVLHRKQQRVNKKA
jgi:hypothetical protein